jgi:hypothetical protein
MGTKHVQTATMNHLAKFGITSETIGHECRRIYAYD